MNASKQRTGRVLEILKNSSLFGDLPDTALAALIRKGHTKMHTKGDVLYRRGEPGGSMAMIVFGRVKITNTTPEGKETTLNFLGAGDLIGEIAVLDGKERTATATAMEDTSVFVISGRDLLPTLLAAPPAMLKVIQVLCDKLRTASTMIEDNTLMMQGRVARGLLRLAKQHGRKRAEGVRIDLKLSQTDLGNYLALSRANVSRQLMHLKDANIIKVDGSNIVIVDDAALEELAGQLA